MFVAKLFVVLLIVSASVCSQHKRQSSVEVEHHGPELSNEECPRFTPYFLEQRCPEENYPSLQRFEGVRSLPGMLNLVRETPLEDFCRDIPAALTCVKDAVLSIPDRCMRPGLRDGLLPTVNAGLTGMDYLCTEEIENIKPHMRCFTTASLVMKTYGCAVTPIMSGKCKEDQVIECISRAIDRTSSCQEDAKEVFERIANRLAEDIQPCAMLYPRGQNRPAIFKFFK